MVQLIGQSVIEAVDYVELLKFSENLIKRVVPQLIIGLKNCQLFINIVQDLGS